MSLSTRVCKLFQMIGSSNELFQARLYAVPNRTPVDPKLLAKLNHVPTIKAFLAPNNKPSKNILL